jgi:hypothetical protein
MCSMQRTWAQSVAACATEPTHTLHSEVVAAYGMLSSVSYHMQRTWAGVTRGRWCRRVSLYAACAWHDIMGGSFQTGPSQCRFFQWCGAPICKKLYMHAAVWLKCVARDSLHCCTERAQQLLTLSLPLLPVLSPRLLGAHQRGHAALGVHYTVN